MKTNKIISFDQSTAQLDIAAFGDILWPCNAYNVVIPLRKDSFLNIFEETILGLCALGIRDTAALADASCMDKELVSFIQNRLSLLGFLYRKEITDRGKAILARKEPDDEAECASAWVFMDLTNGKLLPYIISGNPEYKTLVEDHVKWIEFKIKSTEAKIKKATVIKSYKDDWPAPEENALIRAIQKFTEIHAQYAAFSESTASPPPIPKDKKLITINETPTPVYLHCSVFIQNSNDTTIVTDGFGFGYSDSFAAYIENNQSEIIEFVRSMAGTDFIEADDADEADEADDADDADDADEADNDDKRKRKTKKHRIVKLINKAEKIYKETKKYQGKGAAADKKADKKQGDALYKTYYAMERAFAQIVFERGDNQWESIYRGNLPEDNKEILIGHAKKIGLTVNKRNESMLKPKYGNLRGLMNENRIDMHSVLALAITGADYSWNHPLNAVAKKYPDILTILNDFNNASKPKRHGDSESRNLREDLAKYLEFTKEIIRLLLPDIAEQFDSPSKTDGNQINDTDIERINQEWLQASNRLDGFFGFAAMKAVNPDIKNLLILISNLEKDKRMDSDSFESGIMDLSSALQKMYYKVILSFQYDTDSPSEIKSKAFEKAVRHKFAESVEDIPGKLKGIDTEKLTYIFLQRRTYSLQLDFIVLLYVCDDESLEALYKKCPRLLKFTAELAELRGHNNDFSEEKDIPEKFKALKEETFKAIKALMEV